MSELELKNLESQILNNIATAQKHARERWWHPVVVAAGLFAAGSGFTLALLAYLTYSIKEL